MASPCWMFLFSICVSFSHCLTPCINLYMVPKFYNRISTSCRRLELQFNTAHILECCQKLEEAGEYESDILLVQLVRLQEIRYRMSRSFPYDGSDASRRPDVPVEMFMRAWQKELETLWGSLPAGSQRNCKSTLDKPREAHWLILCLFKGCY